MKLKRIIRADFFEEQAQREIMGLYRKLSSEPSASREERWQDPGLFFYLPTAWLKARAISFKYKCFHIITTLSALLLSVSFLFILLKFRR